MRKSRSDQLTDWLRGQKKKNGEEKRNESGKVGMYFLKSFFSFGEKK